MNAKTDACNPARRSTLETRLRDLQSRLVAIETELEQLHDPDWEEMAVQREGDEVLEASGTSAQQEVRMIRAALARMDDGTYGTCTKCGNAIRNERLDVLPFTPFCHVCASARAGKGGRA